MSRRYCTHEKLPSSLYPIPSCARIPICWNGRASCGTVWAGEEQAKFNFEKQATESKAQARYGEAYSSSGEEVTDSEGLRGREAKHAGKAAIPNESLLHKRELQGSQAARQ